mgnify:CR=1 FL=1
MIEQKYFIDPNTIELQKPLTIFCVKIGKPNIIAKGVAPYHDEEFVMIDRVFETSETIRKLVSLRQNKERLELDFSGEDFILGPNVDETSTKKNGAITLGEPQQLRVWVRNSLRRNE